MTLLHSLCLWWFCRHEQHLKEIKSKSISEHHIVDPEFPPPDLHCVYHRIPMTPQNTHHQILRPWTCQVWAVFLHLCCLGVLVGDYWKVSPMCSLLVDYHLEDRKLNLELITSEWVWTYRGWCITRQLLLIWNPSKVVLQKTIQVEVIGDRFACLNMPLCCLVPPPPTTNDVFEPL